MQSLFGLELTTAQKLIVASVTCAILLGLLLLFLREIRSGRLRSTAQQSGRQRQPRLGIVDTYDLDRQRQLVLIRRDNVEHLLMVGGASDVVVESNIVRGASRSATPLFNEAAPQDRPLPPFETLVPPSEPALRAGEELRRSGPAPEAGEAFPAVPTRPMQIPVETTSVAGAGVAAALGVETRAPVTPPAPVPAPAPLPLPTGQAPSFAREHAPAPAVSPGELDDMTRQLEAALKRPFSAVRPGQQAEPSAAAMPSVTPPAPQPKPENVAIPEAKPAQPKPTELAKPAAPKPAEPTPSPVKPQAMLDMEAELEAALGLKPKATEPRSAEPKTPEPKPAALTPNDSGPAKATTPEPRRVEASLAVTRPVEPEIIVPPPVAQAEPVEPPVPAMAEEVLAPETADALAKAEPSQEAPVASEPTASPSPKADQPKADQPKPSEPAKELDPFSVDAIEAEFARLLGRDPKKS